MTVDRERLAALARAVPAGTFKASVTHNTDEPLAEVVLVSPPALWSFMDAADPETVLALLDDLDTAERHAAKLAVQLNSSARLAHAFQHSTAVRFENCSDAACVNAAAALAEHGDVS